MALLTTAMAWTVEVHPAAEVEIDALPADMRVRLLHYFDLIVEFGWNRVPSKAFKFISQGLWELRLTGRDGIARAFYVKRTDERILVVRVFVKKTQKTPPREIQLAQRRAAEV